MPVVRFSRRALTDLDRIFDFLAGTDAVAARRALEAIIDATVILAQHPLIGRSVEGNVRELVISLGRNGYVALYRFLPLYDRVDVLALRPQREAGFG